MSSKASTTIGFERRFNPALAHDDIALFIAEATSVSAPRPPNMERIVELNRGPFVAAQPEPAELAAPPEGAQILDVRPSRRSRPATMRARSTCRSRERASQRRRRSSSTTSKPSWSATDAGEAAAAIRGLRSVGHLDVAGYVLGGGPEKLELVSVEQLDDLLERGAELIDVREKDERDTGYIAGSRNIPYRLLALGATDLPRDKPIVTICETGPRAAIAASILSARGFDAHPVVNGGIDSWAAAGKPTVEFRRCGG